MENFKSWWQGLEPKEQSLLKLVTFVVLLFLVYVLAIFPAQKSINKNEAALNQAINDHQWLVSVGPQVKAKLQGGQNNQPVERGSLFGAIDQSFNANSVRGYNKQGINNDGVRVDAKNVKFDDVIKAIAQLDQQSEVEVRDMRSSETNTDGIVDISIDFFYKDAQ